MVRQTNVTFEENKMILVAIDANLLLQMNDSRGNPQFRTGRFKSVV